MTEALPSVAPFSRSVCLTTALAAASMRLSFLERLQVLHQALSAVVAT